MSCSTVGEMKCIISFVSKRLKKKRICRTQYNSFTGKTRKDKKMELIFGMFEFIH